MEFTKERYKKLNVLNQLIQQILEKDLGKLPVTKLQK